MVYVFWNIIKLGISLFLIVYFFKVRHKYSKTPRTTKHGTIKKDFQHIFSFMYKTILNIKIFLHCFSDL